MNGGKILPVANSQVGLFVCVRKKHIFLFTSVCKGQGQTAAGGWGWVELLLLEGEDLDGNKKKKKWKK